MDRCAGHRDITLILLKTVLNTIHTINQILTETGIEPPPPVFKSCTIPSKLQRLHKFFKREVEKIELGNTVSKGIRSEFVFVKICFGSFSGLFPKIVSKLEINTLSLWKPFSTKSHLFLSNVNETHLMIGYTKLSSQLRN